MRRLSRILVHLCLPLLALWIVLGVAAAAQASPAGPIDCAKNFLKPRLPPPFSPLVPSDCVPNDTPTTGPAAAANPCPVWNPVTRSWISALTQPLANAVKGSVGACSDQNPIPSFQNSFIPQSSVSGHPVAAYNVGYDPGVAFDGVRHVEGFILSTSWGAYTILYSLAMWLVKAAFAFSIAAKLANPAALYAQRLQTTVLVPLGVAFISIMILGVTAAWHVFTGRIPRAFGEIAVSVAVLILAMAMLSNPAGLMRRSFRTTGDIAGAVLSVASPAGQKPAAATDPAPACELNARCLSVGTSAFDHPEYNSYLVPIEQTMGTALLSDPYMLLQWGAIPTGPCAAIADHVLATGPWGTNNQPREWMNQDPGCKDFASFNADPSAGLRFIFAPIFVLFVAIILILLGLIALTVVAAEILGMGFVIVLPFVALVALAPPFRGVLGAWFRYAALALLSIVFMAFLLLGFAVGTSETLHVMSGTPLALQVFAMLAVAACVLFARKWFLRQASAGARRVGRGFERVTKTRERRVMEAMSKDERKLGGGTLLGLETPAHNAIARGESGIARAALTYGAVTTVASGGVSVALTAGHGVAWGAKKGTQAFSAAGMASVQLSNLVDDKMRTARLNLAFLTGLRSPQHRERPVEPVPAVSQPMPGTPIPAAAFPVMGPEPLHTRVDLGPSEGLPGYLNVHHSAESVTPEIVDPRVPEDARIRRGPPLQLPSARSAPTSGVWLQRADYLDSGPSVPEAVGEAAVRRAQSRSPGNAYRSRPQA